MQPIQFELIVKFPGTQNSALLGGIKTTSVCETDTFIVEHGWATIEFWQYSPSPTTTTVDNRLIGII